MTARHSGLTLLLLYVLLEVSLCGRVATPAAATSIATPTGRRIRRSARDSYNYENFPFPALPRGNGTSLCNVPANYTSSPHICDVDRYLNESTYYELEAAILRLHKFVPLNSDKTCPGWQVSIGLMKQFKDEAGSLHEEFDNFGKMLLKKKWRFLEKCITDIVILVALNDPLATIAMSSYSHGEIPIHCRDKVLDPSIDKTKGAPLYSPSHVVSELKNIIVRLGDIQQREHMANVCHRSWFTIHLASVIAGLTMGVLFVVILWTAYCITGRCGTCDGEVPGYNKHLK